MVDPSLAPRAGEHLIKNGRGANKFYNSSLEQALKDKGIKTVIVTGTSAQGAVAGTSQGATERGFKAIVPVDGMSSEDAFNEHYAAWHLAKGGPVALVEQRDGDAQRPDQVRRLTRARPCRRPELTGVPRL